MNKTQMSWEVFDMLAEQIIENYKDKGIKKVVGLTRGGLPLAVKISNELGIPMETLLWQTRDGQTQDVKHLQKLNRSYRRHEILFVDDICDSGLTIKQVGTYFILPRFAVLVDKIPEAKLIDYSPLVKFANEGWIVFPWEKFN